IQIWALVDMLKTAEEVAESLSADGISVGIVNPRFIKPIDTELLKKHAETAKTIVTLENGAVTNGFGTAVSEFLLGAGYKGRFEKFGWPDKFVSHGDNRHLADVHGLSARHIVDILSK
ncbi:MAG: 1-deoxy-D-xylulose-5-phosphate synthase, partial [Lentisphaerae bacterium]|nr:1-deoxy-D-xylulose-5-phosphate synthase [Lentisphaerota bacterium]